MFLIQHGYLSLTFYGYLGLISCALVSIVCICIDYPSIAVLCNPENTRFKPNVEFMLGQFRRQRTHIKINIIRPTPVSAIHRPNVFSMLAVRRRLWSNIEPALGQCIVVTGTAHIKNDDPVLGSS